MIVNIQKGNKRTLFYGLLALLLGLIFVRYSLQINFPRTILLLVATLIACLGDGDEIIAMCICCMPLYTSFQYTLTVIVGMVAYILKRHKEIRLHIAVLPVLLMILWELLHCFENDLSPEPLLGMFVPLCLCAVLMSSGGRRQDYPFIARALAVTTAGMCLVLLARLLVASGFNLILAFSNLRRLGRGVSGANVSGAELNPNTLGILCVLAMTGILQLRISGNKKPMDVPLVITLMVFGTLTSSRTYLVCLALMAVLLLFSQGGSLKKKIRLLLNILLILGLVLVLMQLLFPDLMEFYYSRFLVEDITTGRMSLMERYNDFFFSSPKVEFFGIGLYDFADKVMNVYHVAVNVPHNGIQELMIAWGIPGLLLFMLFLAAMIWRAGRIAGKHRLIHFIPLLILLAKVQAGQMLTSAYTMLAFSFAYLSLCWPFEEPRALQ